MPRVLVRSGKDPLTVVSPEASLARNGWGVFGANIGNLLFQTALHRAVSVPGTDVVSDSQAIELGRTDDAYFEQVNAEFDRYVVPLANAFRGSFVPTMKRLTAAVRKLTIPVVVVGIGAQFKPGQDLDSMPDEVNDAARDFVTAVLDHSATIGVRGEITAEYLRLLGFPADSIDIIGCPSLYLYGPGRRVEKKTPALDAASRIAMNVTPSAVRAAALIAQATADHPNLTYIPQEHHDLAMMMWGEPQLDVRRKDPRIPTHPEHPLYVQNRMRFFVDALPWLDFLAEQDFAFGTRIHGNVAAMLAGTPAYVVAHDSRTLELARYHGIPHRPIAEIDQSTTVAELYDDADYGEYNRRRTEGFAVYRDFLNRNGIPHVFDRADADGPLEFDTRMSATAFPPAVQVLAAETSSRAEVASRLRWLRQGAQTDRYRTVEAYQSPWEPPGVDPVTELRTAVDALTSEVAKLRKQTRQQKQRIEELERGGLRRVGRIPGRLAREVRSRLPGR